MSKRIFLSGLCIFITNSICCPAYSASIKFDAEKSKINYSFSYLGVQIKKKSLPINGNIKIEKENLYGIELIARFTSKDPVFRKRINYEKYPYFQFWTNLEKPIKLNNKETVEVEGYLSFHGITKKIQIKLQNKIQKDQIKLVGFLNIKMTDFGIKPPKILFIAIDNVIKNKIEIFFHTTDLLY